MARPIRVLHVDDDTDFSAMTATVLEREDDRLSVDTAAGADEAMDRLADEEFDCVVSDYDMPGRDGLELLRSVRTVCPELPFVLFTGKGSEEIASEAISAGVTEYLQKETGLDQYTVLANRIRRAVEHRDSQLTLEQRNRELRRYKRMVNSMRESACVYDAEGRFEIVNEYLAEWYGTTPEALEGEQSNLIPHVRETFDGDPYAELLAGDREEISGTLDKEFPGHGHAVLEYRLTPLWIDGEVEGVVGVARDVTEQAATEERLAAYIDNASDALGIVTPEGRFKDISPAIERITGHEPATLRGEYVFEYVHPDDRSRVQEEFKEMVTSGTERTKRVEYRFEHADGSWVWLESIGSDRTDSALDGYVITTREVTERKRHERELEERTRQLEERTEQLERQREQLETQYRTLFEEAPVMAVVTRTDEGKPVIDDCNQRFLERLGYEEEEVIDHGLAEFYTQESREALLTEGGYRRALTGNFVREDRDLVDADGNVVETLLRAVPRRSADGETSGTLALYVDVTERRTLKREKARLEEFTGVVSHDLRNPLNVAQGHLDLARSEHEDGEHLEAVAGAHDRMATLIDDLLELARSGEQVEDQSDVDLRSVAERSWTHVETTDATLQVAFDGAATIRGDGGRIEQLLENLYRNAVEHGGDDVTVTIGTVADGFYIEDDGPGIPESDGDQVFDPGYTTGDGGTGFGLSIVRSVAEAHGWQLELTEGSEGGARFEITGVERVSSES